MEEHSIMPYYRLFLRKDSYEKSLNLMFYTAKPYCNRYPDHLMWPRGRMALFYCPICHQNAEKTYRSIRRYQQIPGVYVCPEHQCYLKKVPVKDRMVLNTEAWDITPHTCEKEFLYGIAEDIQSIFRNKVVIRAEEIKPKLHQKLSELNVYDAEGRWKPEFVQKIKAQYQELPQEYAGNHELYLFGESILKENTPITNPTEYLIFIRFICESLQKFLDE